MFRFSGFDIYNRLAYIPSG